MADSDAASEQRETETGTDAEGYVHRPSGEPPKQAGTSDEFGWHGWTLVGMVVVAFLVVPGAILVLPAAQGVVASLGLTLRAAYLTLPLVPAFLLAAIAVWSALRSRAE
ncbi:hypothetical protein ACFQGE_09705 [Halomicroarcula sp. GCM10025817]|uniref:hypothetical protein n=1 Tax=Haloarcula TaxID=2237 RepID=UPI0023E8CD1E|nr:hypothetical protein [Halomicroarcula sp. SYNS111]